MATAVTPDVVGHAFVHQYYQILHQSPELVHRFYQDVSKLGRPDGCGGMSTTTTMHAINEKILSLGFGEFVAEIATVDSQESYNGGVLVLVTGHLTASDNVRKKFSQSFFLAPQEKGYFVLNDVFRYVDDTKPESGSHDPAESSDIVEAPQVQESSSIREIHITEPTTVYEEVKEEEVHNPAENGEGPLEDEEIPVPEVVDEIPDDSQLVADKRVVAVEPNNKDDELPRKSYASIVKVLKENSSPFSTPSPSSLKAAPPKPQETVAAVLPTPSATETHDSSTNANGNGNTHDGEADGPSIYVKGLPLDATVDLLENEFKIFGPIRPGGIQVRCVKGFCFGFVEFEVASAVQSALEASPVMINGWRVVVEEKRSTSRGNRGRYSSGSGTGYREGGRGRGSYGGNSFSRGDFSSRGEFGNRGNGRSGYSSRSGEGGYSSRGGEGGYSSRGGEGGYSSRGGEGGYSSRGGDGGYSSRGGEGGYRRADKTGNNGSRTNRGGVLPLNGAAKTTAPQVSATA